MPEAKDPEELTAMMRPYVIIRGEVRAVHEFEPDPFEVEALRCAARLLDLAETEIGQDLILSARERMERARLLIGRVLDKHG